MDLPVEDEAEQIREHLAVISSLPVRYHVAHISCAASLAHLQLAKKLNPFVSAEVTPHHLILNENDVLLHNGTFKVNPPLRSLADQTAMIDGLKSGLIDVIATDHAPHPYAQKVLPLETAAMGFVSLPIMFGLLYHYLVLPGKLTLAEVLRALTLNPARLLSLPPHQLQVGSLANFVVLNLRKEWLITEQLLAPGAHNTPFLHKKVQGWVAYNVVDGVMHQF